MFLGYENRTFLILFDLLNCKLIIRAKLIKYSLLFTILPIIVSVEELNCKGKDINFLLETPTIVKEPFLSLYEGDKAICGYNICDCRLKDSHDKALYEYSI